MIDLNKLKAKQVAHWTLDVNELPDRLTYRLLVPSDVNIADSEGGNPLEVVVIVAGEEEHVSHIGYGLAYRDEDDFYCSGSMTIKDPLDIPTADGIMEALLELVQAEDSDVEMTEDDIGPLEEGEEYETAADATYKLFQSNQTYEAFRMLTETLRESLV